MLIENGIGDFSDAQALVASGESTNILNLVAARHQMGVGGQLWLWLRTNVAADFTTEDETYIFAFEVDDNADFTSPRCVFLIADTDGTGIVTGDPESTPLKTAGKIIFCSTLPQNVDEQYGRWYYTLGGTSPTITLDAELGPDHPPSDRKKDQVYVSNVGQP